MKLYPENDILFQFGAGGPLIIPTSGRWILAGILSYGNECTTSGSAPGIFTRITNYVEWIRMITDPSGCGRRLRSGSSRKKRIVGGDSVQEGEWPWMAALIADGSVFCGGVLITNRHVLTVASCLDE
jgi:secreted trypsin-like serine protease